MVLVNVTFALSQSGLSPRFFQGEGLPSLLGLLLLLCYSPKNKHNFMVKVKTDRKLKSKSTEN